MDSSGGYQENAFIADLYDHIPPYRERSDVTFYVEVARETGSPVLEVGCGTGRVLIPTARSEIDIVGLDLSPSMLDMCRKRLSQEPEEVQARARLIKADMRDFDIGETFRLVTIPFRPFQHLTTVEDQLSCLECIHRHLMEGGRLVFDIFNPSLEVLAKEDVGEEVRDEPDFVMADGCKVVRYHRFVSKDRFHQINQSELIYEVIHPDGREERLVHAFPMRYLFRFEAEHLLARSGFEVEHLYADFEKNPYGSKYPGDLIFVAKKAGG